MAVVLSGWSFFSTLPKNNPLKFVSLKNVSPLEIALLFAITFIVITLGLVAIVSPPNNWDSLTTHMSRVAHWMQNHTLFYYPTSMIRQLNYPPGSAFFILHFQILSFGDRYANLIQWFCMLGSVLGISLIAKQLGASKLGQIFSSVIVATIPMGILQASSTQNDYVVTFWLVCFVSSFLQLKSKPKYIYAVAAAVGLALGFLIKGTGYIFALPFLFWFIASKIKCSRVKKLRFLAIFFLVAILLNGGYFLRNYQLTRTLIPPSEKQNMINKSFDALSVSSNILRNISFHLGTPFEKINLFIENGIQRVDFFLNKEDKKDDSRFYFTGHPFHEDNAGNLMHFILMVVSTVIFYVTKQHRHKKTLMVYHIAVILGFLIFCIGIRWTLYNSRYHLPFFVLYAPFIGAVLSDLKRQNVGAAICIMLFIFSLPWVFINQSRPLIGKKNIFNTPRRSQYFANNPGFMYSFTKAVEEVKSQGCQQIGLWLGGDSWEYPFWVLLNPRRISDVRLEHVNGSNISFKNSYYPLGDFTPCAIIGNEKRGANRIVLDGKNFVKKRQLAFTSVFIHDKTGELSKKNTIYHFNQSIAYANKAIEIVRKINEKQYAAPEVIRDLIHLRIQQLKEAELVDVDELNRLYSGLGNHYRDYLVAGLKMYINGFKVSDQKSYEDGQKMISQWNSWLNQHRDSLKQVFK